MFDVDGTTIKVIQGDTGDLALTMGNYVFEEGDTVYMTVKKDIKETGFMFQKVVTEFEENVAKFHFDYEDTYIPAGKYTYDIQCSLADGRIDTVIRPSVFFVIGGVTDEK